MTSVVYEVPAEAAQVFASCTSLEDWYEALAELDPGSCPTLDAEDSLASREAFVVGVPGVSELFAGELNSPEDGTDDPVVRFAGAALVQRAAVALRALPPEQLRSLLGPEESAAWLQEPLQDFLAGAAENGSGVVLMWGG